MSGKVKVKLFAQVAEIANGKEFELEGVDVREILKVLVTEIDELEELLFKDKDHAELRDDKIVLKDGRNIDYLDGLDTEVKDGDKISIFPVVGGG